MATVTEIVVCKADEEVLRQAEQILKSIYNDALETTYIKVVNDKREEVKLLNMPEFYRSIIKSADLISEII